MAADNLYQVCNLVMESNIPLPELRQTSDANPDYRFQLLPAAEPFAGEYSWFNQWRFQDEVRLSFAFRDDDFLLRFPDADFLVSRGGNQIHCQPLPDIPEATVRHLLLDCVIPLILSRREPLVLHASAILTEQGAIAFIGTSGQGKSTLAASHGQLGYPLISDDYLVLREIEGQWIAVPSYPGVRLLPGASDGIFERAPATTEVAHYTSKRRISDLEVLPFTDSPATIRSVYVLDDEGMEPPPGPLVELISPRESFMKLVSSSFNLDITDKELLRRQFVTLRRAVGAIPCFRLRYAREFGTLPAVSNAIVNHQERLRDDHRDH
jgi:hypothetical protein